MSKSDSVVRIISHNIKIDIFSPYKIYSDSETIGTGFFINNNGYILTCAHVVESAVKIFINVQSLGKKRIPVTLHSICYEKDIAILRTVDYKNQHYCKLGNSLSVNSGDHVRAIGYALGRYESQKTAGIVSGIYDRYIQTDTPINQGNSGGPLFNENDEVIGINTAKHSDADGIGFATPINDFLILHDDMVNNVTNKIIHEPSLYCETQNMSPNHCKLFKCSVVGCIVKKLIVNSPLYNIGVRPNDIITSFDEYQLDENGDLDVKWSNNKINLFDLIVKYTEKSKVNVTYWSIRENIKKTGIIDLSNNNIYKIKYIHYPLEELDYEIFSGMIVMELSMNHIELLHKSDYPSETIFNLVRYKDILKRTQSVVFISNILQGSLISSLSEIHAGSIISSVNGIPVSNLSDFRKAISTRSIQTNNMLLSYIRLEDKNQIIIDVNEAYAEDNALSSRYKYNISSIYKNLIAKKK